MNKTNNYELNLPSGNDIIDIDVLDKNFEIIDRLLKSIESKNHTHDNLTTLNDITATHVSQWDTAWSYSHTHSNKGALDNITQSKIDSWDKAWYNEHTHSNKSILDKITQSMIDMWNAAAGAEVDLSAYALKTDLHKHENKSVLDGITEAKFDSWDEKIGLDYESNGLLYEDVTFEVKLIRDNFLKKLSENDSYNDIVDKINTIDSKLDKNFESNGIHGIDAVTKWIKELDVSTLDNIAAIESLVTKVTDLEKRVTALENAGPTTPDPVDPPITE